MKKLVLLLVMLALVLPAFADDAQVLPAGVLRTYIVPVYSFATQQYDADGEAVDIDFNGAPVEKASLFNVGGAIEYGVNDWISAAVQWTPGYTINTSFDFGSDLGAAEEPYEENVTAKGPAEVFVGAKLQFVGPKAPVQNDMFRVALALGGMIPAAFGYDPTELSTTNPLTDEYNIGVSKNAYGIGARFYADYVINKMFFFNLYSEYKYFLPVDAEKTDFTGYSTAAALNATEVDYGYELTVEAEPHFATMVADGVELSVGVPVTYSMSPAPKYDGDAYEALLGDTASNSLYVKPSVSTFLMKFVLPMEFKVGYEYPLMGTNSTARNNVVFQIKSYMKF